MTKMVPLKEWVCDSCGGVVDEGSGWLEWLASSNQGPREFNIVHNKQVCMQHDNHPDRCDNHLEYFVGPGGLQKFLSMLDSGPVLDPTASRMPRLPAFRSYVDAIRRLHIPYYEEARAYFTTAVEDGWFDDQNEVSIFMPDTCRSNIERYRRP